jgi:tetratricopeptide (TPR) repeat protein
VEGKEQVDYQLCMIKMYLKDYEQADLLFRKMMADYPRGFYFNDALINTLIISESAMMYKQSLDEYVEALYFELRMMPDSVENRYLAIKNRGSSPLVGLSYLKLAEHYAALSDTVGALEMIDEMKRVLPDDYFYPYTVKLKGDILYNQKKADEAEILYRALLENNSTYPFAGEIRMRLQEIERRKPAS